MTSTIAYRSNKAEEKARVEVNALIVNDIVASFKSSPDRRDMISLLEHKIKTYPALWQGYYDSYMQSTTKISEDSEDKKPADAKDTFRIPSNATIIRPFSTIALQASLGDRYGKSHDTSSIIEGLNALVTTSDIIWQLESAAVLGLNSEIVMKIGTDIDIHHIPTLDYIKQHAPHVPIPEIYGILQQADSKRTFLLMSRVPGQPLESVWKYLNDNQKASIKDQLDTIVAGFRFLPAPATDEPQAVLGGGNPRRCKDARRQIRVAEGPISNEQEFNEFITSDPKRRQTPDIAMIKSYLNDGHRILLTHGDLHPSNLMVTIPRQLHDSGVGFVPPQGSHHISDGIADQSELPITITAILNWEMCGWYPEYWEYVKALHTIRLGGFLSDWWAYLPGQIGIWPREHGVDSLLSRWHLS